MGVLVYLQMGEIMMKSELKTWIVANYLKYKNDRQKIIGDCVKRFNSTHGYIKDTISGMRRDGTLPATAFVATKARINVVPVGKDIDTKGKPFRMSVDVSEIAKEYDDEGKIIEAIRTLGTHLIKDNDFRTELRISHERWKIVTGMPKFANYRQELKGKRFRGLYWGAAPVIKELRKKIELL
jgi:hypothetical protein